MTNIIPALVNQGFSLQVLSYLLFVPVIATLIVIIRQVIGLRNLGVYQPLLLTFAFLSLGIQKGLTLFVIIVILANIVTYAIRHFPLLYLPRITIVITTTTLTLITVIYLAYFLEHPFGISDYLSIIIMLSLVDKLVVTRIKKHFKPFLIQLLNTLATAIAGFYLYRVAWLQNQALRYPIIFLLVILVINIILGRFRGLRITELWRFRSLLKTRPKK